MSYKKRRLKRVKTPIFMQMETVDCGAAALGIILAYHGCHVPLATLRSLCLVSRDGVSAANLIKAAKHFGMDATIYQNGLPQNMILPRIASWNRKHYVVLEGISGNKVYINDPKQGPQIIDLETFNRNFSGLSIHFKADATFKKIPKPKRYVTDFLPLIREQCGPLLIMCFAMIIVALINLTPPIFTKIFIDQYILKNHADPEFRLLGVMITMFGVQIGIIYLQRWMFRFLETRFATWLSASLVKHLMQLPLRFFTHRRPGDLLHRLQVSDRLSAAPWGSICLMVAALLQGIVSFALMLVYSLWLSVIAAFIVTVYFIGTRYCQRRWGHMANVVKANIARLTTLTTQGVSLISQLKAECSEQRYFAMWEAQLKEYLRVYRQSSLMNSIVQIISQLMFSIGYIVMMALGTYGVYKNLMTVGEMMACQVLFLSFNDALMQCLRLSNQSNQIEADLQSMTDIMDYPAEVVQHKTVPIEASQPDLNHQQDNKSIPGKIQIIDLTFGYSREFKPLFDHFNMTIEAGSKTAIVGHSGSGKSTLIHLISGLYQPWSGTIMIDDMPLSELSSAQRAHLIGVVSQEQFFYQGSIRDNLCLWGKSYSESEIMFALRMAEVDELVLQTPQGLDYLLLEGGKNLSGGQKQRLEIARTLLTRPRILILDEATSLLDPLIEMQIKHNLNQYTATRISVAHRFNTIQDADEIFILNHGKLVDVGSKAQLISKKSAYFAELFSVPT
ncbi:peptidase domain-containing ABC transporter [Legionella oakridgensis]|uniref:peptidase domain-containing ABC transporter n=1 Tax=Legionella oakridgensis TaxID=29423 RepID=UPI0003DE6F01|nr:ATP-binding cassette domain-containing protein [Legionella oakridgensis]ETO92811.1 ABC-type bacteriocin/lantibiotic exporter [Legionella oakridgensis RV-2-2007]STY20608.1 ABC-type bacteriocin/lantibiotic exporters, contain an N-terminal double-glycine peptidase domain [Legionella longbeachae]